MRSSARVAALYDIHGNLPALEAVLEEVRRAGAEQIVIGGDVLLGPMQRETLACLRQIELPVEFIRGNCELAVLAAAEGREAYKLPEPVSDAVHWAAREILPQHQSWVASWPRTLQLEINGLGKILFCHATPRDENEIFTRLTAQDRLLPLFEDLGVEVVICGHTHMQFDRTIGKTRVVNAGSVGMPFGRPDAYWALLGPGIELRCTAYDLEAAAQRIRQSGYPQAEDFAQRYVLHPPSEEQMLEMLGRAELK